MISLPIPNLDRLLVLTALLVAVGCRPSSTPESHAGHNHAQTSVAASPAPDPDPERAMCVEHGCYEDVCFICNPALREPGRLWCQEHGSYEDRCWECHPELQDPDRLFCSRHHLYEDECFLCHPELKGGGAPTRAAVELHCSEHDLPEKACGICHPDQIPALAVGEGIKVRLPAADSVQLVGIQTSTPRIGEAADGVSCLAEVVFNQNRYAHVVAPVGGIIDSVEVDLGMQVRERQVAARIWSAAIAESVAKAVLTHQTLDRERRLRAEQVTSEKDLQEAEAAHRAACQQLRTLGFTEVQIDELSERPQESVLLEVRVPFDGEVVNRVAVRGALVEAGSPMFSVADRSTVWAMLNLPESALSQVAVNQTVVLSVDGLPGRTFQGRLTWIGAEVDERTRMTRARAEVANPDHLLRANHFAQAHIRTHRDSQAVLVPDSAVQRVDGQCLVFVKLADDLFEARAVQVAGSRDGWTHIAEGLQAAETIAVEGGFTLKSQLLLSRLGAGCVDD